jgi:acyl-CoA synthetase (AMP-forming)/AMP-acid ligase II
VYDIRLVAAGVIPRTTSGKLARRACRAEYIAGTLSTR